MATLKDGREENDIQYLYTKSKESTRCQLWGCSVDLTRMSTQQRQAHYELHFTEEYQNQPGASTSSAPSNAGHVSKTWFNFSRSTNRDRTDLSPQQNIFWYPSQTSSPPPNFSPGLIQVVKKSLLKSHLRGYTQRAWLCFDKTVHIHSEQFDRSWGCGYRNFLMACTALMVQSDQPLYFPLLDDPTPPGVRHLQACVETAWKKGYDSEGAKELMHELLGTSKWIGTAELYVAFTYRGIPARLVDFDLSKKGPEILLNWVSQYFSSWESRPAHKNVFDALHAAKAVIITDKMPLILQHAGHSRTIVGLERCKNNTVNLLVFDPAKRIPAIVRNAGISQHTAARTGSSSGRHPHMHQVLHPVQTVKTHKRKANHRSVKELSQRLRSGGSGSRPGDDAIVISDDDEEKVTHEPSEDPYSMLKIFRLGISKLRRKDKYQILYFPLEPPLADSERWARRVVTSTAFQ